MAIARGNYLSFLTASSTTTNTTFTVTGSNTLLLLALDNNTNSNDNIVSVTWNGTETMTQAYKGRIASGSGPYTYYYYLVGASAGSHNITIVSSPAIQYIGAVSQYTGVKQSGFPNASATATGTTHPNVTSTLTTTANGCWIAIGACNADNAWTANTNAYKPAIGTYDSVTWLDTGGETQKGLCKQTISYPASRQWSLCQLAFEPAVATVAPAGAINKMIR